MPPIDKEVIKRNILRMFSLTYIINDKIDIVSRDLYTTTKNSRDVELVIEFLNEKKEGKPHRKEKVDHIFTSSDVEYIRNLMTELENEEKLKALRNGEDICWTITEKGKADLIANYDRAYGISSKISLKSPDNVVKGFNSLLEQFGKHQQVNNPSPINENFQIPDDILKDFSDNELERDSLIKTHRVDRKDVELVMSQTGPPCCSFEEAVLALKKHNGDIVNAILDLDN